MQSGRDVCLHKNCTQKKYTAPVNSKTRNTEQRNKQQQKKLGSTLHRQYYECANQCCPCYLCKPSTSFCKTHFSLVLCKWVYLHIFPVLKPASYTEIQPFGNFEHSQLSKNSSYSMNSLSNSCYCPTLFFNRNTFTVIRSVNFHM